MRIRTKKQIIESILVNLHPFLEKKDASQITSHIFFKTEGDKTLLKATDMEIGLKIETDQFDIEEEGSFTANGKKLLDIIRILKDEEIIIERIDEHILIRQKSSKFKLPIFDPTAYPEFPSIDKKPKITLNSLHLVKNLKKILPAIDNNNPKHELNGALIAIKSTKTEIVGTDTRRLALAIIEDSARDELNLIIPKKAILEIQKLFLDEIEIYYDDTYLIIKNRDYFFFTRLINGKFPDYERIIPKNFQYEIELPKKRMLDAIKMITTISHDIKIIFEPNQILFHSLSGDNIEAQTAIDEKNDIQENFELALNSKYLVDFLNQIDSDSFHIGLNEPTTPFVVSENNFLTVIMPIIV